MIKVDLSPENPNFTYLDSDHKIILGKSNLDSEFFDVLVFACRDINKKVTIPSYIKHICSGAFDQCKQMKQIEFEENSQLETIGRTCFSYGEFEYIKFPSKLKSIGPELFNQAHIKTCEFDENCPLKVIPNSTFNCTSLKTISLPKDLFSFERNWAIYTKITQIDIPPTNPYLTYIDIQHKIIAGKTDPQSPVFDLLIYACRDVQNANIPASIRHISSYAFQGCKNLQTLQFAAGSSINTLGDRCFCECESLLHVSLPAGLQKYGEFIFRECESLQTFDFLDREIYIDIEFFGGCRNLNVINCPNATKIIYDKGSFKHIGPNFVINRPQNAIFSDDNSIENDRFRHDYKFWLEY